MVLAGCGVMASQLTKETWIRLFFIIFYPAVTWAVFWLAWHPDLIVVISAKAMIFGFSVLCVRIAWMKWEKNEFKGTNKLIRAFVINYPATIFFTFCFFFPIVFEIVKYFEESYRLYFCCGIFAALGWHIDILYSDGNIFSGISTIVRTIRGKSER